MNIYKKSKKSFLLFVINTILKGTHFFKIKRVLLNQCEGVLIGENAKVVAPIYMPVYSELEVGDDSWIGKNFSLEGNGKVIIGNYCDLGPGVTCVTGTHKIGKKIEEQEKVIMEQFVLEMEHGLERSLFYW